MTLHADRSERTLLIGRLKQLELVASMANSITPPTAPWRNRVPRQGYWNISCFLDVSGYGLSQCSMFLT